MTWEQLWESGFNFIPTQANKQPSIIDNVMVGVTSATRDKSIINRWLQEGHGLGIVGGLLGKDNKEKPQYGVILDIDVKKEDGEATLREVEEQYGKLPETRTHTSPSGGRHLLFTSPKEIGSKNKLFPGIDCKGKNGYVLTSPSPGYHVDKDVPIAPLPEGWVIALQAGIKHSDRPAKETFSIPKDIEVVTWFNTQFPLHECLAKFGYKQKGRNTFCHPDGATSPNNVSLLKNTNLVPTGAEFISYHFGAHDLVQEGPHDSFDIFRLRKHGGNWGNAVKEIKEMMLLDTAEKQYEHCELSDTYEGFCAKVRRPELVDSFMKQGDVGMISGASSTHKTFAMIDLACSLATGIPYLSEFGVRTDRAYKTCFILTENVDDYDERVWAWAIFKAKQFNRDAKDLVKLIKKNVFAYFRPVFYGPNKDESVDIFEHFKNKFDPNFKPDLFIIDTFSNNYKGDENDNNNVSLFLSTIREMARIQRCAFMIIHHESKAGAMLRGAMALLNNVPLVYSFKRQDEDAEDNYYPINILQPKCSYFNEFKTLTLKENRFDLYFDNSLIRPRMRTGLVLTVGLNVDKMQPIQPRNKKDDDPTADLADEPGIVGPSDDPDPVTRPEAGEGRGRPMNIQLQNDIVDVLDNSKADSSPRAKYIPLVVKDIARMLNEPESKISYNLKILSEEPSPRVRRIKSYRGNKYLWTVVENPPPSRGSQPGSVKASEEKIKMEEKRLDKDLD